MLIVLVDRPDGPVARAADDLSRFSGIHARLCTGLPAVREVLASDTIDAVVVAADLEPDGPADLLVEVRATDPAAVRVLVGASEVGPRLLADGVVHRLVVDPPSAMSLRALIAVLSATALRIPARLRETIGELVAPPSRQEVLLELQVAVADPGASVEATSRILARDPGLALTVLHLVNAGYLGRAAEVVDIGQAAALLGLERLHDLVVATAAVATLDVLGVAPRLLEQVRDHGVAAARAATRLGMPDHARTAAILLDVGIPLMAATWPSEHRELRVEAASGGTPLHHLERQLLEVTHAEAGALLARTWSLPHAVCASVAGHHFPPVGRHAEERALGYLVHRAVQHDGGHGTDVYDGPCDDPLPAWAQVVLERPASRRTTDLVQPDISDPAPV